MRFYLLAIAGLCCLLPLGLTGAEPPVTAAAATGTASKLSNPPSASDGFAAEAARHAKRTACLNEAKVKKLVGAEKNSYIKNCVAGR